MTRPSLSLFSLGIRVQKFCDCFNVTAMCLALGIVAWWKASTPTTEPFSLQCHYLSKKFGISQLLLKVFCEAVTSFVPCNPKAIVVEGIAKNRRTVADNIGLVTPHVDHDR
jgi:hypothetical protein